MLLQTVPQLKCCKSFASTLYIIATTHRY